MMQASLYGIKGFSSVYYERSDWLTQTEVYFKG